MGSFARYIKPRRDLSTVSYQHGQLRSRQRNRHSRPSRSAKHRQQPRPSLSPQSAPSSYKSRERPRLKQRPSPLSQSRQAPGQLHLSACTSGSRSQLMSSKGPERQRLKVASQPQARRAKLKASNQYGAQLRSSEGYQAPRPKIKAHGREPEPKSKAHGRAPRPKFNARYQAPSSGAKAHGGQATLTQDQCQRPKSRPRRRTGAHSPRREPMAAQAA